MQYYASKKLFIIVHILIDNILMNKEYEDALKKSLLKNGYSEIISD